MGEERSWHGAGLGMRTPVRTCRQWGGPPRLGLGRAHASSTALLPALMQNAWGVGIMKGPSPSSLVALERLQPRQDAEGAWPVANPVLSCATPDMDFVPSHGVLHGWVVVMWGHAAPRSAPGCRAARRRGCRAWSEP